MTLNDPKHWRERAQEARHVAEQITDPTARQLMLRVAVEYERLPEHAAQINEKVAEDDAAG